MYVYIYIPMYVCVYISVCVCVASENGDTIAPIFSLGARHFHHERRAVLELSIVMVPMGISSPLNV